MTEESKQGCSCGTGPKLIFACSGAADVGALSDQAARKLTRDGAGRMYCLAGIGGRVGDILVNTQAASKILAIDGCPKDCALNTLKEAGFEGMAHLRLTDMGFEKGASPADGENIAKVADRAKTLLA